MNASTLTVPVPGVNAPLLRWQIAEARPAPNQYNPGTADFRYWVAEEALTRGVSFWASLLPQGTRWTTISSVLQATLVAGQWLNARYTRFAGLQFYQQPVGAITVFTGESPDVVCHELGHAVLDALRPELFNAGLPETAAFHESFGDMSSILTALQVPSIRTKVLAETQGRLNSSSRLSRMAEQLGWGIRQSRPTAVDVDCLRNAANRHYYQAPTSYWPGHALRSFGRANFFAVWMDFCLEDANG